MSLSAPPMYMSVFVQRILEFDKTVSVGESTSIGLMCDCIEPILSVYYNNNM